MVIVNYKLQAEFHRDWHGRELRLDSDALQKAAAVTWGPGFAAVPVARQTRRPGCASLAWAQVEPASEDLLAKFSGYVAPCWEQVGVHWHILHIQF
jgi:hypothetical protein